MWCVFGVGFGARLVVCMVGWSEPDSEKELVQLLHLPIINRKANLKCKINILGVTDGKHNWIET